MGRVTSALSACSRSRLAHFLVLGGALFAVAPPVDDPFALDVSKRRIDATLAKESARRGGGPLSPELEAEVKSRAIEDELLVREARRLGLDAGDQIVRNRLIQKVLFLAEDLGGASREITETDLRAFYEENRARYRVPVKVDFVHVFAKDEAALHALRDEVVAQGAEAESPPPLGEPFPQPRRMSVKIGDLERPWGAEFVDELSHLPESQWSEPIRSSYGYHLVRILHRSDDAIASFEEVRGRLMLDVLIARREAAVARYLDQVIPKYRITIGGEPFGGYRPTVRSAVHTAPSVED